MIKNKKESRGNPNYEKEDFKSRGAGPGRPELHFLTCYMFPEAILSNCQPHVAQEPGKPSAMQFQTLNALWQGFSNYNLHLEFLAR